MKKILIIEDDRFIADVYQAKLRADGFSVDIAGDGRSGWEMFNRSKPDLVLVDLMLPEINGVDLIRSMRAHTSVHEQLPIIVFSNAFLGGMVKQACEAGASKVLTKDKHTPKQVVQIVKNVLHVAAPGLGLTVSPAGYPPGQSDAEFVPRIKEMFFRDFVQTLGTLRQPLRTLAQSPKDASAMQDLYRTMHSVTANARLAGIDPVAELAAALHGLLKFLWERPEHITASTQRTIPQAIDLLGDIAAAPGNHELPDLSAARILVVDDDVFVQRAVVRALEEVNLQTTCVNGTTAAAQLATPDRFDLIFADIEAIPFPKFGTPIIFLTTDTKFEGQVESVVSEGNDLIGKPFLTMEAAAKALTLVMRRSLVKKTSEYVNNNNRS